MMIKFLKHGAGSAAAATDYLTRVLDSKGEVREEVDVLRGDPGQVADVAESLEFEHMYTSGVFAWAPEDKPTEEQIDQTLDEFERLAWSGLEPDRYAWFGPCCTGIPRGERTSTCWRRGWISRPARASTSPRQVGSHLTARCATGSTKSMDGAGRTTRSGSVSCSRRIEACLSRPSAIPGNRSRTTW